MQILLQSYKAQAIILIFIWIVSMVLSAEFVLSLSMIGLILLAFFQVKIDGPHVHLSLRNELPANLKRFREQKVWLAVTIPFFIVLISSIWSSDLEYTLERLRIKLPFLALPLAFLSMPKMAKRELFALVYFLIGMMFVVSIYVLANFVANYEEVMDLLGRGGHLPTPSNHIRFSLTLAITIIGGLTLWSDKFYFRHSGERYLIASITLFLFVFIHILSVRSGIFALYLALLVLAIQYIISRRKFLLGGLSILAILAIPFIAYFAIPSFKLKIDYARWDYLQYVQDIGGNYPDSERIISIKAGMEIAKKYPFLGAGAGDLKQEVKKLYDSEYVGKYNFRMPHNQFVTVLAGTGIAGLALFVFGFFFPLFYRKNFENPVFLAFHTLIFMSFLMESTIENNFGISIYLLFLLIGLVYLNQSPDISASPEDETTPAPDLTLSK